MLILLQQAMGQQRSTTVQLPWLKKTKGCKSMFMIVFSLLVKNVTVISSLLDIKIFSFI